MSRPDVRGFTLVEVLIVVVIVGILAAVAVFAITGITEESTKNACQTDQRAYHDAVDAYFVQSSPQVFPTSDAQISAYVKKSSTYWEVTNNAPDRVRAKAGVTLPSGCANDPQR